MLQKKLLFLLCSILLLSCSPTLRTSRNQFIQKEVPTVLLKNYKSVQTRAGQNPDVAIAMAISGGGSRASNFAMGVLLEMEKLTSPHGNLLSEIDYFSTVSGGGFAAGAYATALYDHHYYHSTTPFKLSSYYEKKIKTDLALSYTNAILTSWFNIRTWITHLDDGDALERTIDSYVLGKYARQDFLQSSAPSLKLQDFFVASDDTTREVMFPMFIANATIYPSMALFPFCPNIIDTFQISGYTHRMKQFRKRTPIDPYSLPFSVGIKASGSFPVAISNSTLESTYDSSYRYLHLIDGGLADNIGYKTALELLKQEEIVKRKYLIVIDADGGGIKHTFSPRQGGAFSVSVIGKLPDSGLDARHINLKEELETICTPYNIIPIILNFESLIEGNNTPPPPLIYKRPQSKRIIKLLTDKKAFVSPFDMQIFYELVSNISTKYTIRPDEQELLTLAGRWAVSKQRKRLQELMLNID